MPNAAKLTLETVAGDGLRFRAVVGEHQSVLDSGPGRVAASPIETLLVALAGCSAMDVISIMRKQRQQVTGYEVSIQGERMADHPRRYTRIEIVHRLTGRDLDPKGIEHAIHLSHTKYCSVSASLDPAIPVIHRFEIVPDPSPAAAPEP